MNKTAFGQELKDKLSSGINKLAKSVASTLGPSGRNVIIADEEGNIKITKDGVSVAKSFIKLEDPIEHIGMSMIKKVSEKAVDSAGDGTTTATVLAAAIVNEGLKVINQGANNVEVKKGIDKAVKTVVSELKSLAKDITTEEQIKQVATISGNNDPEIGTLIATALDKVGHDGVVYIEESKTGETTLETVEGMQIDRGMKSPYFVTDNSLMQAVLDKPYVLLYDDKIMTSKQLLNMLNAVAQKDKSLLIIADDIEGEALALLIVNKARGNVKVCAVKAPEYGDRKLAILEDIATLTGGTVISTKKGHKLDSVSQAEFIGFFGEARLATITSKDTTIIDGKGNVDAIATRLEEIKTQMDNSKSAFESEILQARLAKLAGGVAIINVGGLSELEMKEKKDRVEDALHATKAALVEGIVPGGGIALLNCREALEELKTDNSDQQLGVDIVKNALESPFKTILKNAGIDNHYKIMNGVNVIKANYNTSGDIELNKWQGYNVKTGQYENLNETGIIDPCKVTRIALENAASVAGTIITTDSVIYTVDEPKKPQEKYDYNDVM